MKTDILGKLIRSSQTDFVTPNIIGVEGHKLLFEFEHFRNLKSPVELILFYKYEGRFYYPIIFEFRGINNNLLYLIEELKFDKFSQLAQLLNSSLEKEENFETQIKAIVCHMPSEPKYCYPLSSFEVDTECIEIFI